jgi:hypothetical protein
MSDSRGGGSSISIGLSGALFLLFIGLRLTDHIDWAWYWVASPLWMPAAIILAGAALAFVFIVPIELISDARKASKQRKAWRDKNGVPKL